MGPGSHPLPTPCVVGGSGPRRGARHSRQPHGGPGVHGVLAQPGLCELRPGPRRPCEAPTRRSRWSFLQTGGKNFHSLDLAVGQHEYHFGVGEFTTHFRTYFSGDWDVHWGYGLLIHSQFERPGFRMNPAWGFGGFRGRNRGRYCERFARFA